MKKGIDKIVVVKDTQGDELRCSSSHDARYIHIIHLTLKLSAEGKERNLGVVDKLQRVFFITRNRAKHRMNKANAYGFDYMVLANTKHFDEIHLTDEYGTYRFPRSVVLDQGKFLHFKKEGYEKQIFLSIPTIEQYKQ